MSPPRRTFNSTCFQPLGACLARRKSRTKHEVNMKHSHREQYILVPGRQERNKINNTCLKTSISCRAGLLKWKHFKKLLKQDLLTSPRWNQHPTATLYPKETTGSIWKSNKHLPCKPGRNASTPNQGIVKPGDPSFRLPSAPLPSNKLLTTPPQIYPPHINTGVAHWR